MDAVAFLKPSSIICIQFLSTTYCTGTSAIWSTPSYLGTSRSYFLAISSAKNLPPTKCLPLKDLTHGFAAVRLIRNDGMNLAPSSPPAGGPFSTSQHEGQSTLRTGFVVLVNSSMTEGNGSRTGGLKEKPKMASMTKSDVLKLAWKSSAKGIDRDFSCICNREKMSGLEGLG